MRSLQLFLISQRARSDSVPDVVASEPLSGLIGGDGWRRVRPCGRELVEGCALIIAAFPKQTLPSGFSLNLKEGREAPGEVRAVIA